MTIVSHESADQAASKEARRTELNFVVGWGSLIFIALLFSAMGAAIKSDSPWHTGLEVYAIGTVVAGACSILGWLLGLLFGIPRSIARLNSAAAEDVAAHVDGSKIPTSRVNTNLEDVSDWLTKTLIGVGLTQLNSLPQKLWDAAGKLDAASLNGIGGGKVYILGVAIIGAAGGFWVSYVNTRTTLTLLFGRVDKPSFGNVQAAADPDNLQFDQRTPVQPNDPDVVAADSKLRQVSLDQLTTPIQMAAWGAAQARVANFGVALDALHKASDAAPNDKGIGALLDKVINATAGSSGMEPSVRTAGGPVNPAFLGHSIFTEFTVRGALTRYQNYGAPTGSPAPTDTQRINRFIDAMKDMQINSVFIQLFTRSGDVEDNDANRSLRQQLITALNQAGIRWAGWGYCAGSQCARNKILIQQFKQNLGMTAFMLDIEPGPGDAWTQSDFNDFVSYTNGLFGTSNLTLTTWPMLQLQNNAKNPVTAMMKSAVPYVGAFVPQAYWMNYPENVHYNALNLSRTDYPPNDPVSFVRMTIKSWSMAGINMPLIIAGQAYWGEDGPDQPTMESKVANFVSNFADWPQILGFSWYHAGKKDSPPDSMSDAMIAAIKHSQLGMKPYQQPPAAAAGA